MLSFSSSRFCCRCVIPAGVKMGFCCFLTDKDRWPVSTSLAESSQPRAGERTLDKRGGSEGKTSWAFTGLMG